MNLLTDNINKIYRHYLIPALGSSMVMSIYTLTDAVVVGKGVGADGLAALNLITPPYCLIMCLGLLFGIGGSVHTSVQKGLGNSDKANRYFTLSLMGLVVSILAVWAGYVVWADEIMQLMGAKGILDVYAKEYMKYVNIFFPFMALSNFVAIYVRTDGNPNRAMFGVLGGGIVNVVLDIILVFPVQMGIGGAALASMIGICVQLCISGSHFLSRKNTLRLIVPRKIGISLGQIVGSGLSAFINELANGFIVCLFNVQILRYCGTTALSVYGVIANCVILFNSLFTGVGQAVQPIISTNYGAGKSDRISAMKKKGYTTVVMMGVIFAILGIAAPLAITSVFLKVTPEIEAIAKNAVRIYFIAFIPMSINVFSCYYFQSVLKSKMSLLISTLRNIVISGVLLMAVPALLGGEAIWYVMVIDDCIVAAICLLCHKL